MRTPARESLPMGASPGKPLRICHIIDSLRNDGAQRVLANLVAGLSRRGYEQRVYCLNDVAHPVMVSELQAQGASIRVIGKVRLITGVGIARLLGELVVWKPAVVQTFLFFGDVIGRSLARAAGVPVVVSSIQNRDPDRPWWAVWLDRRTAVWAHKIVGCSRSSMEFARSRGIVEGGQSQYIPNGVAIPHEPPVVDCDAMRAELEIASDSTIIGMVGRLYPQKGHSYLLSAVARVVEAGIDCVLLVIGDGPLRADLESRARDLNIAERVRFLGQRTDVPRLLRCLDLYVHSSLWEGMPNAVLEAMIAERPVVVTRVDGTDELIRPGQSGWLVDPEDAGALAEGILDALQNPSRARAMGKKGSERVRGQFSAEGMCRQYDELYRRLMQSRLSRI